LHAIQLVELQVLQWLIAREHCIHPPETIIKPEAHSHDPEEFKAYPNPHSKHVELLVWQDVQP
jgi:hypothetical protein